METQLKKRLAILASGGGSNLQSVIDATKTEILNNADVCIVISNKKEAYALTRASKALIETLFINPKDFKNPEEYDTHIVSLLKAREIDLIILAGYLKILTKPIIAEFKNRIINIHPSLLPNYGGKNMYGMKVHKEVIKDNAIKSGCSVHLVTEEIDAGPILAQTEVEIFPEDTPESLADRVLIQEHILLPLTIAKYINTYDWSALK